MKVALPIVIVCSVGIVACLSYIVLVCVQALRRRPPRKRSFDIEDDVLTVKLGKRRKK